MLLYVAISRESLDLIFVFFFAFNSLQISGQSAGKQISHIWTTVFFFFFFPNYHKRVDWPIENIAVKGADYLSICFHFIQKESLRLSLFWQSATLKKRLETFVLFFSFRSHCIFADFVTTSMMMMMMIAKALGILLLHSIRHRFDMVCLRSTKRETFQRRRRSTSGLELEEKRLCHERDVPTHVSNDREM